jgi:hypothetical protein
MLKTYQQAQNTDNQIFKEVIHCLWITSFYLIYTFFLLSYHQMQAIPTNGQLLD